MIEFSTYVVVSVLLLLIGGLLIINNLLVNIKTNLEELHDLSKNSIDE